MRYTTYIWDQRLYVPSEGQSKGKVSYLKPLNTFGTEKKKKVHRCTNNLQGLQNVMVKKLKDLKYYSMKCFTF